MNQQSLGNALGHANALRGRSLRHGRGYAAHYAAQNATHGAAGNATGNATYHSGWSGCGGGSSSLIIWIFFGMAVGVRS